MFEMFQWTSSPLCSVSGRLPQTEETGVVVRPSSQLAQRLHRQHALLRQPGVLTHVCYSVMYFLSHWFTFNLQQITFIPLKSCDTQECGPLIPEEMYLKQVYTQKLSIIPKSTNI